MEYKRAVIFANGEVRGLEGMTSHLEPDDYLIGANGGTNHLLCAGLTPHVIIGDLDSLDPGVLQALESKGTQVLRHEREKNETDLELAIRLAITSGLLTIRVIGAFGGRIDHLLANLSLLYQKDLKKCDMRFIDGESEVFLIRKMTEISGAKGDIVSLIPLRAAAHGVWTEGLQFPLVGESLFPDKTRGISNRMQGNRAKVWLQKGQLLCVLIRKGNLMEVGK